jgi:hypothetical protein
MRLLDMPLLAAAAASAMLALVLPARGADYASWAPLPETFPSTGGEGWMIGEYRPQVILDRCVTGFTAISPEGQVFRNIVVFRAAPAQGGVLCEDGHWAANDRSASGTTPLKIFIRDGVVRGYTPPQ